MNDKKIKRYFDFARCVSLCGDYPKYHIGAIAVYKNKIIASGYNCMKENSSQAKYNYYRCYIGDKYNWKNRIHAEIMVLNKIKNMKIDFSKVSIFVYREYKNEETALSKPCKACERAIKDMGIKNVYYTDVDKFVYEYYLK